MSYKCPKRACSGLVVYTAVYTIIMVINQQSICNTSIIIKLENNALLQNFKSHVEYVNVINISSDVTSTQCASTSTSTSQI